MNEQEPGLPPGERGDNEEAPAEGGSRQGISDADESSGGSRGPSSPDAGPIVHDEHA